ncbi:glycosyltransferase family 9 protein [Desulfovibrio inopinatus]|uniref:glycosyltransferase family 9 protein n=1 Tax=Desulfovibrio inopinatus TaxID=102109 RepID=UPI00041D6DB3|nr:glycosyltransferase family 9 protein [Desulfovibrio inopinatus]
MYKFVRPRTRALMFCIDLVGCILWGVWRLIQPWTWFADRSVPDSPKRILLIRADYIGDVLLITHTLPAIRARFPHAEITCLVSPGGAAFIETNPHVDRVLTYSPPWFFKKKRRDAIREYWNIFTTLRRLRFDLAADFRGDLRNIALFMVAPGIPRRVSFAASGGYYLLTTIVPFAHGLREAAYHTQVAQALGAQVPDDAVPEVYPTTADETAAQAFLDRHGLDTSAPCVVIHPGARKAVRLWPAERYAAVARALIERAGARIILIGAPAERPLIDAVNAHLDNQATIATGEINTLRELAVLFKACQLYIGVSSGPSHLAGAVGLDSVLLFGPETPAQWEPLGNRHTILQHRFPCCPCTQTDCPHLPHHCIDAITVDEVVTAALSFLDQPQQGRS